MKRPSRPTQDDPVFCAETGALISNDQPSNVVSFPREPRKPSLNGAGSLSQPPAVDPGDDI